MPNNASHFNHRLKLSLPVIQTIRWVCLAVFGVHLAALAHSPPQGYKLAIFYFSNWSYALALAYLVVFVRTMPDARTTRRFSDLYYAALWTNLLYAFIYWTVFYIGSTDPKGNDYPSSFWTVAIPLGVMLIEAVISRVHVTSNDKKFAWLMAFAYLIIHFIGSKLYRSSFYGERFHWAKAETWAVILAGVVWGAVFDRVLSLLQRLKFISKSDILIDSSLLDFEQ